MVATSETLSGRSGFSERNRAQRTERVFFGGLAFALLLVVFVDLAPTYFLRESFDSPALTPSLHVHGLLFTSWMIAGRTDIVDAAGNAAWHRRLGVAGAALGVVMMIVGAYVAISRARAGLSIPPPRPYPSRNAVGRAVPDRMATVADRYRLHGAVASVRDLAHDAMTPVTATIRVAPTRGTSITPS